MRATHRLLNLAVSDDLQLTPAAAFDGAGLAGRNAAEAPLGMPGRLGYLLAARRHLISAAVLYARFILIAVTAGVTSMGLSMLQVVRFASMTFLQAR